MEPKYKLKKEVRHLFSSQLREEIKTLDRWHRENIGIEILDELPCVYVEYGIGKGENPKITSLRGWGNDKGNFHFTIVVTDLDNQEYEKVKVPEMMDEIQKVLNKYFR